MKFYLTHIVFIILVASNMVAQKNTRTTYQAGQKINLQFKATNKQAQPLYIHSSYGNTLLIPQIQKDIVTYHIPDFISKKSGWIHWSFPENTENNKGSFYISPLENVANIETYLGPPSLLAGTQDYAMLVTIPLDRLDNPLPKGTPITIHQGYVNEQTKNTLIFDGMTAHHLIYTQPKSGRMFISATCKNKNTKEHSLEITPNQPTDFKLFYKTNHHFADGNQIVTFTTSVLKDVYNNIVVDGTLVNFKMETNTGQTHQTYGSTIHGIASAKIIHPDFEQQWKVTAFVNEMAKSKPIDIQFKEAISEYRVEYHPENKTLFIGDFKSYMHQFAPDGLEIFIQIFKNHQFIKQLRTQTENGGSKVYLGNYLSPEHTYTLKINAANQHKEINIP